MSNSTDIVGKNHEDILISVIVPVYNVKDYLSRCIESLCGQTHSNIEIMVIDDGSTDGCGELVDKYASEDKRIRTFHTVNSGLSAARNVGLDAAVGDYIMFVDSDDFVEESFCKDALEMVLEHQVEVASFGYNGFWTDKNEYVANATQEPRILSKEDAIRELIDRKDAIYNMVSNKIFIRHLFDKIRFPVGKTYEDMAVMHLVFDKVSTGIYISNKILYNYRQAREGSITAQANTPTKLDDRLSNELDRLQFINTHYPSLKQNQINVLVKVCESCFLYMPGALSDTRIENFLKTNMREVLVATAGLKKFKFRSYYTMPVVFYLINTFLRRFVYHVNG